MMETALVPHSPEAEEAVLGACLIDPDMARTLPALRSEDFYLLRHGYIWQAMQALIRDGQPVDYLLVQSRLSDCGKLNEVGGPAYLTHLMNSSVTSIHAPIYAGLIQRAAMRRSILMAADAVKGEALNEDKPVEAAVNRLAESAAQMRQRLGETAATEDFSDLVSEYLDYAESRMSQEDGALLGVPTGFKDLDDLEMGNEDGDLILIGGAPGMGKTALMLSRTINQLKAGYAVGFISLEMSKKQLFRRLLAMETGIPLSTIRRGQYNVKTGEWRKALIAMDAIKRWPLYIEDRQMTIAGIGGKFTEWRESRKIDIGYVDYIQIVTESGRAEKREQEVTRSAYGLKNLAKELNMPIVAGAQINREINKRENKRPTQSDLRESGGLEQAADIVEFVYRDVVYNPETEFPNTAEIIVAKHRNGETGTVQLHFERSLTRFSDSRTQTVDLSPL